MKIINANVEFITPIDGQAVLKHIEQCGRVCYKSEAKITDTSAPAFVAGIIKRGHESVLEHYSFTVKFTCDRGVSHELVRHRLASYCVTGDTVIRGIGGKSWTVKELFDWQSDKKRKGRLKLIEARSMDDATRTIVGNRIMGVHFMGEKPVFGVRTESGRTLKCTGDHRIATPGGYVPLSDLSAGDEVLSNGFELLENPDWIRWYYIEENHTRKETAEVIGCSEATLYKVFQKYGIKKPWSDRPNRHPGHGRKGMFSAETKQKLSEAKSGIKNSMYKEDRSLLTVSGAYQEANRMFAKERCENCGVEENLEIHHIDKNPRNNVPENAKVLCSKCHKLWHKPGTIGVFRDKIASIEPVGVDAVYDISMADPHHNFVANGVVVHNCQESTRYCNYNKADFGSEITVIKPCFLRPHTDGFNLWEESCLCAEQTYFNLLECGCSPQEARSVLPNSLKTEVIMTANIREWRHFLKLRCSPAAHLQMQELALILLEKVHDLIPVCFDDLWSGYH